MKLIQKLSESKKTLFSIEILPPLKGKSIQSIYDGIDPLMEFKPAFVDVTYHREEYIYKKREGGYLEKVSIRKRPGTVGICAAIMNKYDVEAVPHIICGGFTKEETENALIDLQFLGIDNVLALRGDSIKTEPSFVPEPGGHHYALDLVTQIDQMNKGKYMDEEMKDAAPTNFCIGIAGYPEKHFEAPNLISDLKYLKAKVDAGAEYVTDKNYKITPKAAFLLAEFLGNDLNKITNEFKKLIINLPEGNEITPELVQDNIGISKEYNVFELQDALSKKDILKTNQIINYFAANEKENPTVIVISSLYGYFSKILKYHFLPDKSKFVAASALGVNPFFIEGYARAASFYNTVKLKNIFGYLKDIDLKSKGVNNNSLSTLDLYKELIFKIMH